VQSVMVKTSKARVQGGQRRECRVKAIAPREVGNGAGHGRRIVNRHAKLTP
jgi:hypothetical protein